MYPLIVHVLPFFVRLHPALCRTIKGPRNPDWHRQCTLNRSSRDERNGIRQADFQHHQGTCPGLPMNWRSTPGHSGLFALCSYSPKAQRTLTMAMRATLAASFVHVPMQEALALAWALAQKCVCVRALRKEYVCVSCLSLRSFGARIRVPFRRNYCELRTMIAQSKAAYM
ncbi:hypothetical protein V8C37DRAFT_374700 [Trichoderma ceciliae]